ncbi:hypothetical protein Tco_0242748 [Tanacetum coccineum]
MSTPVFVDPEISTQADEAQSPRVLVPFLKDPYKAIRQAYLVETETPKSPNTVASPTLLLDSTPPTRHAKDSVNSDMSDARPTSSDFTAPLSPDHPLTHTTPTLVQFLRRNARMVVRVPPAMSPGLSASIAEVAAMSDLAFRKRFRSSYESSPSSSPPDLPSRKHYRCTSELVEDKKEEEDEEIEESSDSDSESEDAKDEGPTIEDEDLAEGDEGLAVRDEGPDMRVESLGLGGDAAVPEGQQRAAQLWRQPWPTLTTWIDPEDGIAYIDVPAYPPLALPVQTPPSPEWLSGSLPVSPAPSIVPLPISSPMIPLTIPSPVASPATAETEGFLTESGAVRNEIFSQRYRFKSLEHEQERVVVTFRAIWRPVLALESWAEERRAWLDLDEVVDRMRRWQEPRGDV